MVKMLFGMNKNTSKKQRNCGYKLIAEMLIVYFGEGI